MNLNCPNCENAFEIVRRGSETEVTCPSCKSKISLVDLLSIDEGLSHTRSIAGGQDTVALGESIGHFRLTSILGKGGFGTVYEAYDARLERRVALKLPRLEVLSRWQAEVFIREAQAAARLQHRNLVSVFEVGRDKGRVYIVSELIDGLTLNDWYEKEKPDAKRVATVLSRVARALHAAHQAGVVHRDIKPRNILVDAQDEPFITDFGLAKRDNPRKESITRAGQIIGTLAYMPPEQALGKGGEADGRADTYSVGVMLYEMLVKKRPYRGETDVISEEVIRGGAIPPREIDNSIHPDINAICMKAMHRRPGERYSSAEKLADDLDNFVGDQPTLALPPNRLQSGARFAKRNRRGALLVVAGILLGVTGFGGWYWHATYIPENYFWVDISVSRSDCEMRVVRVDQELGKIKYSEILLPRRATLVGGKRKFVYSLQPGWHIFETLASDKSVHEVWRLIPESLDDVTRKDYQTTGWEKTGEKSLTLKPIEFPERSKDEVQGHEMVRYEGGEFEVGVPSLKMGDIRQRPEEILKMDSFAIAKYEVSLKQYESVMGDRPMGMKISGSSFPPRRVVSSVRFIDALEYCERVGGRLPYIEEFLYVTTNQGRTNYPWGDTWILTDSDSSLGNIGAPSKDRNQKGVFNLVSNAMEWTCDVSVPKRIKNGKVQDLPEGLVEQLASISTSRLVVGAFEQLSDQKPARLRYGLQVASESQLPVPTRLGFRVYRSLKPRLYGESELVEYYQRNE